MQELIDHTEGINRLMARFGVKFGIYQNGEFHEPLFPFDAIPRVIPHKDFQYLEKGLIQRVDALNCFLRDIYTEKKSLRIRSSRRILYFHLPVIFPNVTNLRRLKAFTAISPGSIWYLERIRNGIFWRII